MQKNLVVRQNLINEKEYTPYCGNNLPRYAVSGCRNPRTVWNPLLNQFICHECGWISKFPDDFIEKYKSKWGL